MARLVVNVSEKAWQRKCDELKDGGIFWRRGAQGGGRVELTRTGTWRRAKRGVVKLHAFLLKQRMQGNPWWRWQPWPVRHREISGMYAQHLEVSMWEGVHSPNSGAGATASHIGGNEMNTWQPQRQGGSTSKRLEVGGVDEAKKHSDWPHHG